MCTGRRRNRAGARVYRGKLLDRQAGGDGWVGHAGDWRGGRRGDAIGGWDSRADTAVPAVLVSARVGCPLVLKRYGGFLSRWLSAV